MKPIHPEQPRDWPDDAAATYVGKVPIPAGTTWQMKSWAYVYL